MTCQFLTALSSRFRTSIIVQEWAFVIGVVRGKLTSYRSIPVTQAWEFPDQRHKPSAALREFLDPLSPGLYLDCGRARLHGLDDALLREAVSRGRSVGDDSFVLVITDVGLIYCRPSIAFAIAARWSELSMSVLVGETDPVLLPVVWPHHGELDFTVSRRLATNVLDSWHRASGSPDRGVGQPADPEVNGDEPTTQMPVVSTPATPPPIAATPPMPSAGYLSFEDGAIESYAAGAPTETSVVAQAPEATEVGPQLDIGPWLDELAPGGTPMPTSPDGRDCVADDVVIDLVAPADRRVDTGQSVENSLRDASPTLGSSEQTSTHREPPPRTEAAGALLATTTIEMTVGPASPTDSPLIERPDCPVPTAEASPRQGPDPLRPHTVSPPGPVPVSEYQPSSLVERTGLAPPASPPRPDDEAVVAPSQPHADQASSNVAGVGEWVVDSTDPTAEQRGDAAHGFEPSVPYRDPVESTNGSTGSVIDAGPANQVATGSGNTATGSGNTATGSGNTATGSDNTATGSDNTATGSGNTATGSDNTDIRAEDEQDGWFPTEVRTGQNGHHRNGSTVEPPEGPVACNGAPQAETRSEPAEVPPNGTGPNGTGPNPHEDGTVPFTANHNGVNRHQGLPNLAQVVQPPIGPQSSGQPPVNLPTVDSSTVDRSPPAEDRQPTEPPSVEELQYLNVWPTAQETGNPTTTTTTTSPAAGRHDHLDRPADERAVADRPEPGQGEPYLFDPPAPKERSPERALFNLAAPERQTPDVRRRSTTDGSAVVVDDSSAPDLDQNTDRHQEVAFAHWGHNPTESDRTPGPLPDWGATEHPVDGSPVRSNGNETQRRPHWYVEEDRIDDVRQHVPPPVPKSRRSVTKRDRSDEMTSNVDAAHNSRSMTNVPPVPEMIAPPSTPPADSRRNGFDVDRIVAWLGTPASWVVALVMLSVAIVMLAISIILYRNGDTAEEALAASETATVVNSLASPTTSVAAVDTAIQPIPDAPISDRNAAPAHRVSNANRNCNINYLSCVPMAEDVDCQGDGDGPVYVTEVVNVVGEDVYGLDTDNDGQGCEPDQPPTPTS